ncbi:MAG: PD-(D/E)XK nuclease family protein [Bacillota bacterium]
MICKYAADMGKDWDVHCCDFEIIEAVAEKNMLIGRSDIFIIAKGSNGVKVVLTIENKIFTWEHDNQTNTYFKWVENQRVYKKYRKVFIYLKPEFNQSQPSCQEFLTLTYADIFNNISVDNNKIIADFKEHIKQFNNRGVEIMSDERFYLENYKKINEVIMRANSKRDEIKERIVKSLEINLKGKHTDMLMQKADGNSVFRFYRKDKWYENVENKENKYYFYVEIMFEGNDISDIVFQQTVKSYGHRKGDSIITKFMANRNYSCVEMPGVHRVIRREKFIDNTSEFLSEAWIENLTAKATAVLLEYIDKMDEMVDDFVAFRN